ncbi:hypothetical protein F3Y22_tig00117016pilonHSYRG00721 [Hibiscus syriacus]|uniref:Uncharacterized protein n=1 Tax=Hibiscus syriacus TaxID=106335 RepID=A0A6A2WCL1_HIBSY|nr:hypothetical protein F3Y22_tig00117016pilonHSYRG00721 [Hibiscus syriacus]
MDGWAAVSDEDVEAILPTAVYALAKIHMHLVHNSVIQLVEDSATQKMTSSISAQASFLI